MTKREIIKGACVGGFCSMSVLALLEPFGIDRIEQYRLLFIFCEGVLAVVVAILSVSLVQLIFHPRRTVDEPSRWRIALAHLYVHLFNIPLLSAVLLSFNSWMHTDSILTYWNYQGEFSLGSYMVMLESVAIISVFVYVIELFDAFNSQLKLQLDEVKSINELLISRLERMQQDVAVEVEEKTASVVVLESASGGITLSVVPSDIVYIESMSNYADVCYLCEGQICHRQLRITMKQLKERLSEYEYLVSSHRAYIVNLNFVSSLAMRPGSEYYELSLFALEKQIPVSRSNTEDIKRRLK